MVKKTHKRFRIAKAKENRAQNGARFFSFTTLAWINLSKSPIPNWRGSFAHYMSQAKHQHAR